MTQRTIDDVERRRGRPAQGGLSDPSRAAPSTSRIFATTVLVLLPVLLLAAAWVAQAALFLLIAGMLFAAILDAATRGLCRAPGLTRPWAVGTVIAAVVAGLAALVWFGGSTLVAQAEELYSALQQQARRIGDMLDNVTPGSEAGERETIMGTMRDLGRMFGDGEGRPGLMAQSVLGMLANAAIIFFIGIFLALDPGLYKTGVVRLFPVERRPRIDEALRRAGDTLRLWLVGKLLSMALIATLTFAGLMLVGYPLALPLALLAGLLAFVPNLGPILTYVPIAMAGFAQGPTTILLGVGVYAVAQIVESYVFTPLIQKRMVSLPPALILFAQVLGGVLFGLWGVALATPIAAVLRLWIEKYYVEATLEEADPSAPREISAHEAPARRSAG